MDTINEIISWNILKNQSLMFNKDTVKQLLTERINLISGKITLDLLNDKDKFNLLF